MLTADDCDVFPVDDEDYDVFLMITQSEQASRLRHPAFGPNDGVHFRTHHASAGDGGAVSSGGVAAHGGTGVGGDTRQPSGAGQPGGGVESEPAEAGGGGAAGGGGRADDEGGPTSEAGGASGASTAAGAGGSAPGGAPGDGNAGQPGAGLVDCGGESCAACCYIPGAPPQFSCIVDNGDSGCGFVPGFYMTCDAKSDCADGQVCCMEQTRVALRTYATCATACPIAIRPTLHYELCGGDEECTAPQHCVALEGQYFHVCQ